MSTVNAGRAVRPRGPSGGSESVLDKAVLEFNARGYDATSMEDLSRAVGITKSSFYHHFAGKEALLRAALERALDGLFSALEEPPGAEPPIGPSDRLRRIVTRQVRVLMVQAAADAGEIREGDDPVLAARLLSGLVNSVAEWYRPGRRGMSGLPEDVARAAVEGILPAGH